MKAAYEKAQAANGGKRPSQEQIIAAFENLISRHPAARSTWRSARATRRSGHGVWHDQDVGGKVTVVNVKRYPGGAGESPRRRQDARLDQVGLQDSEIVAQRTAADAVAQRSSVGALPPRVRRSSA